MLMPWLMPTRDWVGAAASLDEGDPRSGERTEGVNGLERHPSYRTAMSRGRVRLGASFILLLLAGAAYLAWCWQRAPRFDYQMFCDAQNVVELFYLEHQRLPTAASSTRRPMRGCAPETSLRPFRLVGL